MTGIKKRVALAMMAVTARLPADRLGIEVPVLSIDPDFDDLPADHTQGTEDDTITQKAVMKLVFAAIAELRTPTEAMLEAGDHNLWDAREAWQAMIDAALAEGEG